MKKPYNLFIASLLAAGSVSAASVNVNFRGGSSATMASSDIAGVVPDDNWNNIDGTSGTNIVLNGTDGLPSSVTLTFTGAGGWFSNVGSGSGDQSMFKGYLDGTDNGTNSIIFGGLGLGVYDLYIYSLPDNLDGRDMSISVNGSADVYLSSEGGADFDLNGFVRATATTKDGPGAVGNYFLFEDVSPVAGQISITGTSRDFRNFQNGIQLVQVPEPASTLLLGIGTLGLLALRRRA